LGEKILLALFFLHLKKKREEGLFLDTVQMYLLFQTDKLLQRVNALHLEATMLTNASSI